ncbi:MAG: sugar phosphate isomerase/epimerase [Planctomycetes bacterium]|nr:sugar phosphate isomerase/epimerase [Planctomycetota bacterium]
MKLSINPATTMPASFEEDVIAYAEAGFDAMEIWLSKIDDYMKDGKDLKDASQLMNDNNMAAAGACFSALTFSADESEKESFDQFKTRLQMCQALGAETLVVIPTVPGSPVTPDKYDTLVEGMARCCDIAEPYGVSLAIEFIKGGGLIGSVATAADIANRTQRDNIGVLFDTFHFYMGISKVSDIRNLSGDDILLIHLNDCPDVYREIAEDGMRILPGEGAIPLQEILGAVRDTGYNGFVSLEIFNQDIWDLDVKHAAKISYDKASSFFENI